MPRDREQGRVKKNKTKKNKRVPWQLPASRRPVVASKVVQTPEGCVADDHNMVHPSSYLAYCWHLSYISQSSKNEEQLKKKPSGSFTGRRRQKFRDQRGPSREELQRARIVSILQQIPVLDRQGLERFPGFRREVEFAAGDVAPSSSVTMFSTKNGTLEMRNSELPHQVLWPLFGVAELGEEERFSIDWDGMPATADPLRGGGYKGFTGERKNKGEAGDEDVPWCHHVVKEEEEGGLLQRGERKRSQVYTIAAILKGFHLPAGSVIVDFGCGSGALSLPLASLFPDHIFVCVDYKQESIRLLNQRAQIANLSNVMTWHGRIEDYVEPFDVCVALHACGKATDLALLQALKYSAAYIVSPCCVGKLQFSIPFSSSHDVQQGSRKTRILRPNTANSEESKDSRSIVSCLGTENGSYDSVSSQYHHNCLKNAVPVHLSVKKPVDVQQLRDSTSEIEFAALGLGKIGDQKAGMDCLMLEGFNSSRLNDQKSSCPLEVTVTYPRSNWLCSVLSSDDFISLVRMADWSSYDYDSCDSVLHTICKVIVELDRNEALQEHGYLTRLICLSDQKAGVIGVAHVLVGRPIVGTQ